MKAKITYRDFKYNEHELEVEITDFRITEGIVCFHYVDGEYRALLREQIIELVIIE